MKERDVVKISHSFRYSSSANLELEERVFKRSRPSFLIRKRKEQSAGKGKGYRFFWMTKYGYIYLNPMESGWELYEWIRDLLQDTTTEIIKKLAIKHQKI